MPKEVDLKLDPYKQFMGMKITRYYNKIGMLNDIIKYIIGINRKFENNIVKIDRFCTIWNIVNHHELSEMKLCDSFKKEIDSDEITDEQVFNIIETSQTTLKSLVQVIGYELMTILKNNLDDSMNEQQIMIIDDFINTDLKNINEIDMYKIIHNNDWFRYVLNDINEPCIKYNYTPIKIYKERNLQSLPKMLTLNKGFNILEKMLNDN
jgi:hypothetical protein